MSLDHAIFNTIRYFDLFDLPITATQIWQCLILDSPTSRIRWSGIHQYSLREVREALQTSAYLKQRLGSKWGYFFLQGKESLVTQRLARHRIAERKWKMARRLARRLAYVPLVKMIAGSGSLALDNTRPESDFDFLVVVAAKRIWTARLLLLIAAQATGRRRRHWDSLAPDKICLNHYVTEDALAVPREIRNIYTAVAYRQLVPLFHREGLEAFQQANAAWMKARVMYGEGPLVPHRHTVTLGVIGSTLKRVVEAILREPIANGLERLAEKLQRRVIMRHSLAATAWRVHVSDTELAFHPHSKVPEILARFEQDVGQKSLL